MHLCVHVRRTRGEEKGRRERTGRGRTNTCGGECACEKDEEGGEEKEDQYLWWKEYVQEGCGKRVKERERTFLVERVHERRIEGTNLSTQSDSFTVYSCHETRASKHSL